MYRPFLILGAFLAVTIVLVFLQPGPNTDLAIEVPDAAPTPTPEVQIASNPPVPDAGPTAEEIALATELADPTPVVSGSPIPVPGAVEVIAAEPVLRPLLRPASVTLAANERFLSEQFTAQAAIVDTPVTEVAEQAEIDITLTEVTDLAEISAPLPEVTSQPEQASVELEVAPTEPEVTVVEVTRAAISAPALAAPVSPPADLAVQPAPEETVTNVVAPLPASPNDLNTAVRRTVDGTLRLSLMDLMASQPAQPLPAEEAEDPYVAALKATVAADPPAAIEPETPSEADIAIRIMASPVIAVHTVRSGDSLADLSERFYGDRNGYIYIFLANRALLTDPEDLSVGQVLRIPSIDNL